MSEAANGEIWWRDLATTMKEMPVDGSMSGSQQGVSLFGRKVALQSNATGPWNVYLGNLFYFTG